MQKGMFSNKNKKAQLTIFIVLAIIIVVGVGVYFFASSQRGKLFLSGGFGEDVRGSVEQCIEDSTLQGIYLIGLQGGYYSNVPEPKEQYSFVEIPVYYDAKTDKTYIPSIKTTEKQLALAIEDSLVLCSTKFQNKSYQLDFGEISSVRATINSKDIDVSVNWPITITEADKTSTITDFSAKTNFDYMSKYNSVSELITAQQESPKAILFEKIGELGIANNFDVETIDITNQTTIYTLIYSDEIYNGAEFIYAFVIKYG